MKKIFIFVRDIVVVCGKKEIEEIIIVIVDSSTY